MSTGTGQARDVRPGQPRVLVEGGVALLRNLLGRPLASYYLLLGSAGLLLVIGLAMVFSATSVEEYASNGSAYASIVNRRDRLAIVLRTPVELPAYSAERPRAKADRGELGAARAKLSLLH